MSLQTLDKLHYSQNDETKLVKKLKEEEQLI